MRADDPYILDSYGWLLFKKGKTKDAMKLLEKAYAHKPEEAIIAEHLGDIYVALNFGNNALKAYTAAHEHFIKIDEKNRVEEKIKNVKTAVARKELAADERDPASLSK